MYMTFLLHDFQAQPPSLVFNRLTKLLVLMDLLLSLFMLNHCAFSSHGPSN